MASSDIEVCNRALGRVGVDQLIEDFDDPNNRARQCRLAFVPCRDETLQDFPWNFAQTSVALALASGVTIPGWGYAYFYPDACLKVHAITSEFGMRHAAGAVCGELWNYDALGAARQPFAVMAHPTIESARILVTDQSEAYAWYTKETPDMSLWSPLARSALSWKIAGELALSLKADARLAQTAANNYTSSVSTAQAGSLNESRDDPYPQSPSIQARL